MVALKSVLFCLCVSACNGARTVRPGVGRTGVCLEFAPLGGPLLLLLLQPAGGGARGGRRIYLIAFSKINLFQKGKGNETAGRKRDREREKKKSSLIRSNPLGVNGPPPHPLSSLQAALVQRPSRRSIAQILFGSLPARAEQTIVLHSQTYVGYFTHSHTLARASPSPPPSLSLPLSPPRLAVCKLLGVLLLLLSAPLIRMRTTQRLPYILPYDSPPPPPPRRRPRLASCLSRSLSGQYRYTSCLKNLFSRTVPQACVRAGCVLTRGRVAPR